MENEGKSKSWNEMKRRNLFLLFLGNSASLIFKRGRQKKRERERKKERERGRKNERERS